MAPSHIFFALNHGVTMTLPLLTYLPISQNQRVSGYEVGSDEAPRIYDADITLSDSEKGMLIRAAYRQIFHEQNMLESYRQPFLESQLRACQITVKDFVYGLATSDAFRRLYYDTNSNYRFVQLCIQRILGRDTFGDREKIAWSTVIATQGMDAFIEGLINTQEYEQHFGDSVVPYQRRRLLPLQMQGDLPFMRMARYDQQERPDLITQPSISWLDPDQDVGKGLFIAAIALLVIVTTILVFGSAASL
jgi:phycobilisome rod-core linker protein